MMRCRTPHQKQYENLPSFHEFSGHCPQELGMTPISRIVSLFCAHADPMPYFAHPAILKNKSPHVNVRAYGIIR